MQLQEKKVASGDDAVVNAFSTTGAEPANIVPDLGVNEHRVVHIHRSRRSRRRRAANRYAWRFQASPALVRPRACRSRWRVRGSPCGARAACSVLQGLRRHYGTLTTIAGALHALCTSYILQAKLLQVLCKQHLHGSVKVSADWFIPS